MNQQWMNEWRQLELDCSRLPGQITSILFIYLFYDCIVPLGFLSWDIRIAFPRESRLRQSHATQPTVLSGCFSASIIHRVDYRIFNVHTHVNACDCTRGCTDTVRESLHWKSTLGEKSLAAPGNRTCVSGVAVRCSTSWAISPPSVLPVRAHSNHKYSSCPHSLFPVHDTHRFVLEGSLKNEVEWT